MKSLFFLIFLFSIYLPAPSEAAFVEQVTLADLTEKYKSGEKIKILIIPGHDNDFSGASFGGMKEVELNRIVAGKIYDYFVEDEHFLPVLSQVNGDYIPELKNYFETEVSEIEEFKKSKAREMKRLIRQGKVEDHDSVTHGTATTTAALRLYGTNKWANENDFDLLIHVHFNDYGGRSRSKAGEYGGFSIYVPERHFPNSEASMPIAEKIYERLERIIYPSSMPGEAAHQGPIEDQDLIALGANNTLEMPSILIEYSYIYEPLVQNADFKEVAKVFAYQTYAGIESFFLPIGAPVIPVFSWNKDLGKVKNLANVKNSFDIFSLQMLLKAEGLYPPRNVGQSEVEDREDCPITGKFGVCTEKALKAYQEKYGISPATGFLGPKTRDFLNTVYGK